MTYWAGIAFGTEQRRPRIVCDGCGETIYIEWPAPNWFLDGKPKRGWKLVRFERLPDRIRMRSDYCPNCKAIRRARTTG